MDMKKEEDATGESNEANENIYEELFSYANSDNEIVKKESLRIILSLLEENELIEYIRKNNKKCFKIIISNLNSRNKMLSLECLLNLSARLPKELTERNIIEILFDMVKEEEKYEENCIDLYIMIISNITRCKEGIYKILDLKEDTNIDINEEKFFVSYYLNKLLYFFFLPIKPSINKNINDKYIYVSHILINISSIKESSLFFKNVSFLNKISEQILNKDRFRAILPFIINLCLNETTHNYLFHDSCILFPYILSYIYTNNYSLCSNNIYNSNNVEKSDNIHHIILQKATVLINCSIIKSRIIIILLYLCKKDYSREKLHNYGIYDILRNWKSHEKDTELLSDIENIADKFEAKKNGKAFIS
ncbi:conserved Plasmodium protein, unknown function [Plasmodium gallinaceum]|uniref:Protein HGH1 N-terminal domain-containing protein n=1 Tax=Plasmodium gallinaceum TaxID=5849 RepID=A0A1J1GTY9_PLAGA|nr:conserved Plasmodium protein, unknown function [Plasmodium gallinaceum]CRG95761.1 conserved Plasmodium protein, unknown function [Plasmodium gallinaceum]